MTISLTLSLDPPLSEMVQRIADARSRVIDAVADELLALSREMFDEKSHGQPGADAVRWPELTPEGLRSRARRRPEYQALVQERKELTQREASIRVELRQALAGRKARGADPSDRAAWRRLAGGLLAEIQGGEYYRIKDQRQAVTRQQHSLAAVDNGLIGVDTGAMGEAIGSATADGTLFEVVESSVTIGVDLTDPVGVHYPAAFDKIRTLLPEDIPDRWVDRLTAAAIRVYEEELGS